MVVSPDLHPQPEPDTQELYRVEVTLRLVDRLLSELDVDTGHALASLGVDRDDAADADCSSAGLAGRVVHALKLTETLADGDDGAIPARALQKQLQTTLRGLLVELERATPRREAV